ncbi:MAG: VOC family protein [Nitrospinota bacterium]
MAIPIRGLHHITIPVSDLARARAFYTETLGFREVPEGDSSFPSLWLEGGGFILQLVQAPRRRGTPPSGVHLAFAVEDFEATLTRLQEAGIPFNRGVRGPQGFYQAFFQDPEGNLLELLAHGPPLPMPAGEGPEEGEGEGGEEPPSVNGAGAPA